MKHPSATPQRLDSFRSDLERQRPYPHAAAAERDFARRRKLPPLFAFLAVLAGSLASSSIATPLSVARIDGWTQGFDQYDPVVTPGWLYPDCRFVPNPGVGHTLPAISSPGNAFFQAGQYYVFAQNEMVPDLQAAFPSFSFTINPNPDLARPPLPGDWNNILVHCSGGGGSGSGTNLRFEGRSNWRTLPGGRQIRVRIPKIANRDSGGRSGTIRVDLMAGRNAGRISQGRGGRIIASKRMNPLSGRHFYRSHTTRLQRYRAPRGSVRTCLLLSEYSGSGFSIRDSLLYRSTVRLSR